MVWRIGGLVARWLVSSSSRTHPRSRAIWPLNRCQVFSSVALFINLFSCARNVIFIFIFFFFVCVLYLLLLIGSEPQRVINIFLAQHFRGFIRPELVALWQLCLEISVIYDAFLGGMPLFTISDFIMEEDERNCFCSE